MSGFIVFWKFFEFSVFLCLIFMETGSVKNCINTLIKPTITLAKKLGLIEAIYIASPETDDTHRNDVRKFPQEFDYLIVVDFESTCWEGNRSGWRRPEIIEFPAVLLNLSSGDVEDEFQQYVSPSENQKLSEFCKTLTGITQQQVDDGVPLATCLVLFNRWILQLSEQKKLVIHKRVNDVNGEKSCTFVTWSDWDFSSCLHNECRRKQISKPEIFNKWIDLRAIYREFYKRSPKGLRGALQEVGLAFEGREHSGLHDARNTAHLAWRMACDGAQLGITKTLLPNTSTRAARKCVLEESCSNAEESTPVRKPLQNVGNAPAGRHARVKPLAEGVESYTKNERQILANINASETVRAVKSQVGKKSALDTPEPNRKNQSSYKTPATSKRPLPSSSCKKTPPLCHCGRRAVRKLVSLPGPNQGRRFFTCSNRKSLGMKTLSGCGFFRWDMNHKQPISRVFFFYATKGHRLGHKVQVDHCIRTITHTMHDIRGSSGPISDQCLSDITRDIAVVVGPLLRHEFQSCGTRADQL